MKVLFALAGLHRVHRGAEVAFISVARELTKLGDEVTLIGSGEERPGEPYRYLQAHAVSRDRFERWPSLAFVTEETAWEQLTFVPGLLGRYRPSEYDITATCAYPFTNWTLRRPVLGGRKPRHVYITQCGDWPALSNTGESRLFGCDGMICTNPDFFERNRERYLCSLIPNGVDLATFHPGPGARKEFGLPDGPMVLMVSSLIASKNIEEGIKAIAQLPGVQLVVAGDGPMRKTIHQLAAEHLPGRFHQITLPADRMPLLYRSADVFMHLSVDESFGNVFVEALATGLPMVAYDTPRTRWIVGDHAVFPDGRSRESLVAALRSALRLGRPGAVPDRVQRFGWPAIAQQYQNFFEEVLGRADC